MTRERWRRGYTVGITIFVGVGGDLGLYENGLRQNVLFLWQLFTAAPDCARVHLLNHGDGEFAGWPEGLGMDGVPVVRTASVVDDLDYVIVIGAAISREELLDLRARGIRLIGYKGGNAAVISMEATIAKPTRGDAERYFDVGCYDALWMTPQHTHTYAGWAETIYRAPVRKVPQIWGPTFIANRAHYLDDRFGYRLGSRPWRIGIMDPNITVMKTSHVAMLACEVAYRRKPSSLQAVFVSNSLQKRSDPHFSSFANALSVVKDGVMSFEPRFVSADFLSDHCDAVVTHHWENGLNYLYYEVLYGGYPLIHNSTWLKSFGYYYEDFEAEAAGDRLIKAHISHDQNYGNYIKDAEALFAGLAPSNGTNIETHERLLLEC